ncbi:MAG TPA: PEP-CTERM sorting domain-containing protein [Verrucomicrobiae bacterium]|nr:PEP-CTERM sorting domain-containing protein [Verrucomicrobiae bacterium]
MKTNLAKHTFCLLLAGVVASASAQSTWNFYLTDAGSGNSLVTWNVTGDIATPPGSVLTVSGSILTVAVSAPGIYAGNYLADGTDQSLPTPDGSYFQLDGADLYGLIGAFYTDNAPGSGNDGFGLAAFLAPHAGPGLQLLYVPGTQSAVIPVDFSNFNPGTYQSQELVFNTALTVNLTVANVPEPSLPALMVAAAVGAALTRKRVCVAG